MYLIHLKTEKHTREPPNIVQKSGKDGDAKGISISKHHQLLWIGMPNKNMILLQVSQTEPADFLSMAAVKSIIQYYPIMIRVWEILRILRNLPRQRLKSLFTLGSAEGNLPPQPRGLGRRPMAEESAEPADAAPEPAQGEPLPSEEATKAAPCHVWTIKMIKKSGEHVQKTSAWVPQSYKEGG